VALIAAIAAEVGRVDQDLYENAEETLPAAANHPFGVIDETGSIANPSPVPPLLAQTPLDPHRKRVKCRGGDARMETPT